MLCYFCVHSKSVLYAVCLSKSVLYAVSSPFVCNSESRLCFARLMCSQHWLPDEELDRVMAQYDTDKSGAIDREEYKQIVRPVTCNL